MQRFHSIAGFQFRCVRLNIGLFLPNVLLNAISTSLRREKKYMQNILITGLLMVTSNTNACEIDWDNIELDDFQDAKPSCVQSLNYNDYFESTEQVAEYEKIEEMLKKHWEENTYSLNKNEPLNNEFN